MMYNNNNYNNSASTARGFVPLCAALAMGLGLMASPAEADDYAYVANDRSNNVSVIDTTTIPPAVVATVGVGAFPYGVAVTPDRKHVYVANNGSNNVSVIDTTTIPPSVVGTVTAGTAPVGVAVSPDGKYVYVANNVSNNISVIDTTTTPRPWWPRSLGDCPPGGRRQPGREIRLCRE
jgi:YVTN family beta-propeller protein